MTNEELAVIMKLRDQMTPQLNGLLGKWRSSIMGVVKGYLTFEAARRAIGAVADAGMEADKVWNGVAASLARHGMSTEEYLKKIQDFSESLMMSTGKSDELIGEMMGKLIDFNMELPQAQETLRRAMDMSVRTGQDLNSVITLLGRAYLGSTQMLSRYGIVLDESTPKAEKFAAALKQIDERFGGAARADLATYSGQLDLLKEKFGNMLETIFEKAKPFTSTLMGVASAYLKWLEFGYAAFANVISTAYRTVTLAIKTLVNALGKAAMAGSFYIDSLFKFVQGQGKLAEISLGIANDAAEGMALAIAQAGVTIGGDVVRITGDIFKGYKSVLTEGFTTWLALQGDAANKFKETGDKIIEDGDHIMSEQEKRGIETLKRLRDQMLQILYQNFGAQDEATRRGIDTLRRLEKTYITMMHSAAKDTADKNTEIADAAESSMSSAFSNISSNIMNTLGMLQIKVRGVWANMAMDFMKYFVDAVMRILAQKLAVQMVKLLGSIFDNPINDAIAFRQGADYAKYVSAGADYGFRRLAVNMPQIAGRSFALMPSAPQSSTVRVHIGAPMLTKDMVRKYIVPVLQNEIYTGRSRISIKSAGLTGSPDVVFD